MNCIATYTTSSKADWRDGTVIELRGSEVQILVPPLAC